MAVSESGSPSSESDGRKCRTARPTREAALGRRTSSRASSRARDDSLEPADGSSDDRRHTLSTLFMSEAEERLLSSSSGDSEESSSDASTAVSSDDDDGSSDASSSSYGSSSSHASTHSSAASFTSSKSSNVRLRRSSVSAAEPLSCASIAPAVSARPDSTSSSAAATTPSRRSPTKRRHVFDSPQYRADAFFDPENVAIVRSSTKTATSLTGLPVADGSNSTLVAAAHASVVAAVAGPQLKLPLPPVCLSELIAASTPPSTPRKTPRRARPRPTETWDFISRSPHPFASAASSSTSAVATPIAAGSIAIADSNPARPASSSLRTTSPPSSPDFPPASLIRPTGFARLSQPPKLKQEPNSRTERRKSGKCFSALPSSLQPDEIDVIELTSESEMVTPVGRPAITGKGRPLSKRRIVLSESEDDDTDEQSAGTLARAEAIASRRLSSAPAPARAPAEVIELSISDEEPPSPPIRRPPPPLLTETALRDDEDDDVVPETDDEDAGVLYWSPPPPPRPNATKPVTPAARKKAQPLQAIFRQPAVGVDLDVYDSPPSSPVRPSAKTPAKKAPKPKTASSGTAPPNVNSKLWKTRREMLALGLIRELDASVFDHLVLPTLHLAESSASAAASAAKGKGKEALPQGVNWTGRLKSTAGMSRWTRRMVGGVWEHHCCIELSSKVLDSEEKILSTTAHEMCHLAVWIHHGKDAAPHGKEFRAWGKRVMRARPDIEVNTKHDYEIVRKFTWRCTNCPATYGRDTKSIDVERHACGRCSNRLVADFATAATPAKPNAYQHFIKTHFTAVRAACPAGSSAADVMRELGVRYRAEKATAGAQVDRLAAGVGGLVLI